VTCAVALQHKATHARRLSPHARSDGLSAAILTAELAAAYGALAAGQAEPSLAPLAIQYADFSAWQRARLASGQLEAQRAYWRQQLAGAPALLELPTDYARPSEPSGRGDVVGFRLPAALTERLRFLAVAEKATMFMVMVAAWQVHPGRHRSASRGCAARLAWDQRASVAAGGLRACALGQVLLAHYSRSADVVVGTPLGNRSHPELEGLIGYFVNSAALRTDLSGAPLAPSAPFCGRAHACHAARGLPDLLRCASPYQPRARADPRARSAGSPTLATLVKRVKAVVQDAVANADIPFPQVVEAANVPRSSAYTPVYQTLLTLEAALGAGEAGGKPQMGGLAAEELSARALLSLLCSSWLLMPCMSSTGNIGSAQSPHQH